MGRWILDLLLLLNLVVFLWGSAHQVPLAPVLPPLPEKVPRLQWLPPLGSPAPAPKPQGTGEPQRSRHPSQ